MQRYRQIWLTILLLCVGVPLFAQPGSVLINEVMYDDTATTDVEWVELYNTLPVPISLSNWVLSDGNVWPLPSTEGAIQIPPGVIINSFGYLVLSKSPLPGIPSVICNEVDPSWTLNNGGDNLALFDGSGPTAQLIDGSLASSFPDLTVANSGNSLEKCNQDQQWTSDPLAWHESTTHFSPVGRFRNCSPGMLNSTCAPVCGGTLQAPPMLIMLTTYVGMSTMMSFPITNTGAEPLCIDSLRTNGHIFTASVPPLQLGPGEGFVVDVVFSPTFEYDFEGEVTIYHAQATQAKTKVMLLATACTPASPPPPPILHTAGSPHHLYFSMPWDPLNSETTKYAVEYSSDGFATSNWVAPSPAMYPPDPVFVTLGMWGQGGRGVISGLAPAASYEVRLRTQDCAGTVAIGPSAMMATEPAFDLVTDPDLTIQVVHPDSVRLSWNPVITESLGRNVQGLTWGVYFGTLIDLSDDLIGTTTTGSYVFGDVDSLQQGYFVVRALGEEVLNQPHPFISWPPANSELAGLNTVVIQDYLHQSLWDSFTVVLDPETDAILLGSSHRNPWDLAEKNAVAYDFSAVTPGPHTIRATVFDPSAGSFTSDIHIIARSLFQRDFNVNWDQLRYLYLLDTVGVTWQMPYAPTDVLWETSKGQRYGSPAVVEYEPTNPLDSLVLIKIKIPTLQRYLSEYDDWFDDNTQEFAGVEQEEPVKVPKVNISCCCDNLEIRTAGVSDGTYCGQKNVPLGATVTCAGGNYEVSFAFEVVLTLKYFISEVPADCYWGQDAKGDRSAEIGTCKNGAFVPLKPPDREEFHKEYGGVEYPRGGAAYGNDDYRPDRHGGTLDQSQQIRGKVRWWDKPGVEGPLPGGGLAIRYTANDAFFARADPQCQPVNIECCRSWEIVWDVTFCADCSIIQTTPPTFQNEQTPLTCPALAAN